MSKRKSSASDTIFFGLGLIFDIVVIVASLIKEVFESDN